MCGSERSRFAQHFEQYALFVVRRLAGFKLVWGLSFLTQICTHKHHTHCMSECALLHVHVPVYVHVLNMLSHTCSKHVKSYMHMQAMLQNTTDAGDS